MWVEAQKKESGAAQEVEASLKKGRVRDIERCLVRSQTVWFQEGVVVTVAINILLDRSGSMGNVKLETISGLNAFKKEQATTAAEIGEDVLLFVEQFDSEGFDVVVDGVKIGDAPDWNSDVYEPRGMTPLYDSIGKAIGHLDNRLAEVKPDRVVFVMMTDGLENASSELNKEKARIPVRETGQTRTTRRATQRTARTTWQQ